MVGWTEVLAWLQEAGPGINWGTLVGWGVAIFMAGSAVGGWVQMLRQQGRKDAGLNGRVSELEGPERRRREERLREMEKDLARLEAWVELLLDRDLERGGTYRTPEIQRGRHEDP